NRSFADKYYVMVSKLKKSPAKSAFSLIELMVVVGILAILASLAVPRFRMFTALARQAEAKTTVRHIMQLQINYFNENNRYFSSGGQFNLVDGNWPTPANCNIPNDLG